MRKSTLKFYKVLYKVQLIIFGFRIYTNKQYYDKYCFTLLNDESNVLFDTFRIRKLS